jgi:hypothetical protein
VFSWRLHRQAIEERSFFFVPRALKAAREPLSRYRPRATAVERRSRRAPARRAVLLALRGAALESRSP